MLIENYLGWDLNYFTAMTYHASVDRETRIRNIIKAVGGFGQVVATEYQPEHHACRHITDLGVVVVTDEWCERLITAWIPDSFGQLFRFFPKGERIPCWLEARVRYAQKKQKQATQKREKRIRFYDEEDETY